MSGQGSDVGVGGFDGVGAVGLQGGGFDPFDRLVICCNGHGKADDFYRLEVALSVGGV